MEEIKLIFVDVIVKQGFHKSLDFFCAEQMGYGCAELESGHIATCRIKYSGPSYDWRVFSCTVTK